MYNWSAVLRIKCSAKKPARTQSPKTLCAIIRICGNGLATQSRGCESENDIKKQSSRDLLKIERVCKNNVNFKKMKKTVLILVFVGFIATFISCDKEGQNVSLTEKENFNEDLIPQKLSFQKNNLNPYNRGEIIIVEWDEWGRKKKDCKGWGLCDAVWFPKAEEKSVNSDFSVYSTILQFDQISQKYFIDILLSEVVPIDIPIELYPLPVDESFIIYTEEAIGRNLIFEEGEYPFDETLGSFGGFRIYLN